MALEFEYWAAGLIVHDGDVVMRHTKNGDYDLPYEAVRRGEQAIHAAQRICPNVGLRSAVLASLEAPSAYMVIREAQT